MSMTGRQGTQIAGANRLLNGVNNLIVDCGNARALRIQAALVTSKGYYLWYRLEYADLLAATTIPTADGLITHGGTANIECVDPTKRAYLYFYVTDDTGAAQNGGALDYALITREQ